MPPNSEREWYLYHLREEWTFSSVYFKWSKSVLWLSMKLLNVRQLIPTLCELILHRRKQLAVEIFALCHILYCKNLTLLHHSPRKESVKENVLLHCIANDMFCSIIGSGCHGHYKIAALYLSRPWEYSQAIETSLHPLFYDHK